MSLRPFAGVYVPQCTPFGFFKVVQVHGSTGHSWCVNPETGAKVDSSDVAPGAGNPQCGKCFYELAKFLGAGIVSMPGRQRPQCDENGLFSQTQHSGSTGYSWCVNPETGDKIEGTETGPTAVADCEGRQKRSLPGPCTTQSKPNIGAFLPQCTPFGFFKVVQVHGSSGYSYCVNPETGIRARSPTGAELAFGPGSKVRCPKCLHALAKTLLAGPVGPVGMFRPQCDEFGLFTPLQSHGSTGSSWCVNPETGDKIEGTETGPTAVADCEGRQKRSLPGPCTAQSKPNIGAFLPQCTPFGFFKVVQVHGSSGYSYCVNPETGIRARSPTGAELAFGPGTKVQCPKCLHALAKTLLAGPVGPVGMFRPQCDEFGQYNPVQSHGSTGYSWCVDPETGVKIEGSDAKPGVSLTCGPTRFRRAAF